MILNLKATLTSFWKLDADQKSCSWWSNSFSMTEAGKRSRLWSFDLPGAISPQCCIEHAAGPSPKSWPSTTTAGASEGDFNVMKAHENTNQFNSASSSWLHSTERLRFSFYDKAFQLFNLPLSGSLMRARLARTDRSEKLSSQRGSWHDDDAHGIG